jgi:hypothetical protein
MTPSMTETSQSAAPSARRKRRVFSSKKKLSRLRLFAPMISLWNMVSM